MCIACSVRFVFQCLMLRAELSRSSARLVLHQAAGDCVAVSSDSIVASSFDVEGRAEQELCTLGVAPSCGGLHGSQQSFQRGFLELS